MTTDPRWVASLQRREVHDPAVVQRLVNVMRDEYSRWGIRTNKEKAQFEIIRHTHKHVSPAVMYAIPFDTVKQELQAGGEPEVDQMRRRRDYAVVYAILDNIKPRVMFE
jgi:diadenosine tetraphosphate (Ap4A) HIT family hydrolase